MKISYLMLTVFLFVGMISCNEDSNDIDPIKKADPIKLKSEYTEKISQDNTFAFNLLKTTYEKESASNIFVSPLSVSMALSMTVNGAKGETAEEMLQAMSINNYSVSQINDYNKTLREALLNVDPSTQIGIANSIWSRKELTVVDNFITTTRNFYTAEFNKEDFTNQQTVEKINNWCSNATNGKIPVIIQTISSDAAMFLINAVYFKGIWQSKFDKSETANKLFAGETQQKTVKMMRQNEDFAVASTQNGRYLHLPYGNGAFTMVIMLPDDGKSTDDLLAELNANSWKNLIFRTMDVNLELPRFKIECKYELEKNVLPAMGMNIPFTPSADFSGITPAGICISQVLHKTYINVDEEGTEAAAVTSVGMNFTSAGPSQPTDFFVDKPFVFVIQENSTGVILFAGKIGDIEE